MSTYRLPDGSTTRDVDRFVVAWRALAAPVERLMGWRVIGYDPGVLFQRPAGGEVELPEDLCAKIGELMRKRRDS